MKKTAMTSSQRVQLSRWVNKVEEAADILLDILKEQPTPLPRQPIIDPELIHRLSLFTLEQDDAMEEDYPKVMFLQLGNGHQVSNKRRALQCTLRTLEGSSGVDQRTIKIPKYGMCHFAAFTHAKGAMISSTKGDVSDFGALDWHSRDHICMFRDVGDGRCIIYINEIEPLFSMRTIGQHGVLWEKIQETAKFVKVISSSDALKAEKSMLPRED